MDTKIRKELETIGLKNLGEIKQNLSPELLVEEALFNKEGVLTDTGAFRVVTGKFTGRSPEDRFIVKRSSYAACFRICICRAVHWQYILLWQEVIHSGEYRFFHFTAVAAAHD